MQVSDQLKPALILSDNRPSLITDDWLLVVRFAADRSGMRVTRACLSLRTIR